MMRVNNLMKMIPGFALAAGLLLLPITGMADVYYKSGGEIYDFNDKAISIGDNYYPYLVTMKVFKADGSQGKLSDLKKDQYVELTILNLDDKRTVERIDIIDLSKQE